MFPTFTSRNFWLRAACLLVVCAGTIPAVHNWVYLLVGLTPLIMFACDSPRVPCHDALIFVYADGLGLALLALVGIVLMLVYWRRPVRALWALGTCTTLAWAAFVGLPLWIEAIKR